MMCDRGKVEKLRNAYLPGTKVRLIRMEDAQAPDRDDWDRQRSG